MVRVFLQHLTKWGPRAGPAQRVAWGEGGDPEHSRRKTDRVKRSGFLSRAEGTKKRGPRASPAQRVAWGEGGAAEYSRRNGSRQKRLPFLSRTELAPTWCGQQDSNLHGFPLEPKSSVSANSTMPASLRQNKLPIFYSLVRHSVKPFALRPITTPAAVERLLNTLSSVKVQSPSTIPSDISWLRND